jgi:uncharacterized protein YjiS (DUF1127 family)
MNPLSRIFGGRRRRLGIRDLRALPPELLLDIGVEPDRIGAVMLQARRAAPKARRAKAPDFALPGLSNSAWPYPWRGAR